MMQGTSLSLSGVSAALAAAAWLAWMIFNVVVLPLRAAWAHRLPAHVTDRTPLFVDTEATWRLP